MLDQRPPCDPAGLWRPTIAPANTFAAVADDFITRQLRKGVWKSAKHERQWHQTLADLPRAFRDRPVNQIDAKAVYEAFAPILGLKIRDRPAHPRPRPRSDRLRPRARGHSPNPATWSGWLKTKLGDPSPTKRDRRTGERVHRDNHAAMRWQDVPKLVEKLEKDADTSALALTFGILTGLRASEARKAKWERVRLRRPNAHRPVERAQDWQENENLSHYSVVGGGADCAQENDGDTVGRLRLHGPPRQAAVGEHALRGPAPPRADRHRARHALGAAPPSRSTRRGPPSRSQNLRWATSSATPPRRPICAPTRSNGGASCSASGAPSSARRETATTS